jgi:hypothetical protein
VVQNRLSAMVRFCGDTLLGGPEIEEEDSHGMNLFCFLILILLSFC